MGVSSPNSSSSRTSSPVTCGSPADSQTSRKRKRASKPKVRTGCVTWIRRVKCGEEKPACVRCTSTGRTCDGYDKGVPPRNRTLEFQRNAETAKSEFIKAYQWNEALRSMRPIVADIDGTESEKKFFRRFRGLATDGLQNHVCNFTQFWNRITPNVSHYDEAVKHAVIALGASYQIFSLAPLEDVHDKRAPKATIDSGSPDEFTYEDLEVFTIQQYNKSISKLARHVGSSSPESIHVTLICCLAFICIETMRGHHEAAVTHLINGLNILRSIPLSEFEFLADLSNDNSHRTRAPPWSSQCDMRDIIDLFGRLEICACFFASGLRPVVAERGYAHRKYDDGTGERYPLEYHTPKEAHKAYTFFLRDVIARLYETSQEAPGSSFWADPRQQRQQNCLRLRAMRLDALMHQYLTGPLAPVPDTDDHYCIYLDLLHFRTAQIMLAGMDERIAHGVAIGRGMGYVSHLDFCSSPTNSSSASSSSYSGHSSGTATTPQQTFSASPMTPDTSSLSSSPSSSVALDTLPPRPDAAWLQADLLAIAALLNTSQTSSTLRLCNKQKIFFNDAGTIGPVYLVALTSTDPDIRARAFRILAESGGSGVGDCTGFFWDGPGLRQRLGLMVDPALMIEMSWQTGMGMLGLTGGPVMPGTPLVQDALDRLQGLRLQHAL